MTRPLAIVFEYLRVIAPTVQWFAASAASAVASACRATAGTAHCTGGGGGGDAGGGGGGGGGAGVGGAVKPACGEVSSPPVVVASVPIPRRAKICQSVFLSAFAKSTRSAWRIASRASRNDGSGGVS